LHYEVKMLIKGEVLANEGDNLCAIVTNKGLMLKAAHSRNDELCNSETIVVLEKDQPPFDFDPYSNFLVNTIFKRWGYSLGLAVGQRAQGWTTFPLSQ